MYIVKPQHVHVHVYISALLVQIMRTSVKCGVLHDKLMAVLKKQVAACSQRYMYTACSQRYTNIPGCVSLKVQNICSIQYSLYVSAKGVSASFHHRGY